MTTTTIGMNYRVRSGMESAFESRFRSVLDHMAAARGHVATHLYKDALAASASYLVVSEWADQGAFDAFVGSEAFRSTTAWGAEKVLEGRPAHRVFGQDDTRDLGRCPVHTTS